jgi:hypothetical protein
MTLAGPALAQTPSADAPPRTTSTAAESETADTEPVHHAIELPPDPYSLDPVVSVGFHLGLVVPVARDPLCPSGSDCVFQGGGSFGVVLERRWPSGPAIGLGYQLWFLDASGIYELGLMQELRAQFRYLFLMEAILHPFLGAGIGAVVFGDTFAVATVGVAVDAFLGVELELTETISVHVAIPWRVFRTDSFTTRRDRVRRAEEAGFNVAASLELGLAITGLR